jgi:hypothetical protein
MSRIAIQNFFLLEIAAMIFRLDQSSLASYLSGLVKFSVVNVFLSSHSNQ